MSLRGQITRIALSRPLRQEQPTLRGDRATSRTQATCRPRRVAAAHSHFLRNAVKSYRTPTWMVPPLPPRPRVGDAAAQPAGGAAESQATPSREPRAEAMSRHCGVLIELDDLRRRLHLWRQSYVGVQAIPVAKIIGTSGRCCDFDRCFHPLRQSLEPQLRRVRAAFPDGDFPTISVYKVDDAYFVVDGHKRVAAARALGAEFVDAEVTAIPTPYGLDQELEPVQLAYLEAEDEFRHLTGLARTRPRSRFSCTSLSGFAELREGLMSHGYDLSRERGLLIDLEEVAKHWYDCLYLPVLHQAREQGLSGQLPSCTETDLFLTLHAAQGALLASAADDCPALAQAAKEVASVLEPQPAGRAQALLSRLWRRSWNS